MFSPSLSPPICMHMFMYVTVCASLSLLYVYRIDILSYISHREDCGKRRGGLSEEEGRAVGRKGRGNWEGEDGHALLRAAFAEAEDHPSLQWCTFWPLTPARKLNAPDCDAKTPIGVDIGISRQEPSFLLTSLKCASLTLLFGGLRMHLLDLHQRQSLQSVVPTRHRSQGPQEQSLAWHRVYGTCVASWRSSAADSFHPRGGPGGGGGTADSCETQDSLELWAALSFFPETIVCGIGSTMRDSRIRIGTAATVLP